MSVKKTNTKKATEKKGRPSHRKSSTPINLLFWIIFCCSIAVWGVVFGSKYSEFDREASIAERQIALLNRSRYESVLGITAGDSTDGETTVGEELSETIAQQIEESDEQTAEEVTSVVDAIEEERKNTLRETLLLQLPKETDNPNYPMTFVNPTEKGVEIQVDGSGFATAISPYVLPALSIGEHIINIRFEDTSGVMQNLEESVIVIPRAPVWAEDQNEEFRSDESIIFKGTALPNSRVILLVSSTLESVVADADSEGVWTVGLDDELDSGEHTAVAFVRKSGFASDFSEPLAFTVGYVEGASSTDEDSTGEEEDQGDSLFGIIPYSEENYYLVLGGAGLVIVILLFLLTSIIRAISHAGKKTDNWVLQSKAARDSASETVSLREKFKNAGIKIGKEKKETSDTNEDKKTKVGEEIKEAKEETVEEKKESEDQEEDVSRDDKDPEKAGTEEDKKKPDETEGASETDGDKSNANVSDTTPGKVFSKEEFLEKFGESETVAHKETNKIRISLTSNKGK